MQTENLVRDFQNIFAIFRGCLDNKKHVRVQFLKYFTKMSGWWTFLEERKEREDYFEDGARF